MDEPALDALDERLAAQPESVVCPFLVSAAGPWRGAEPARDHRCSRLTHETRLDLNHQRQYCVGSGGPGCSHYITAPAPGRLASMLPVILDRGPLGATLEQDGFRRVAAPATVLIIGAALGALLLARGPGASGPATGATAGATVGPSTPPATPSSPPETAAPTEAATPTSTPSSSPLPTPLPTSTPAASVSPAPGGGRTYTVRPGDTLGAIAARFGTSTRVLVQLNGIADPSYIRSGQVLKLP